MVPQELLPDPTKNRGAIENPADTVYVMAAPNAQDDAAGNISKYASQALCLSFKQRFHRGRRHFAPDDAPMIFRAQSDMYKSIIDGFYIVGNYPWAGDPSPTVLYSMTPDDPAGGAYAIFLLPQGSTYSTRQFHHSGELLQHLYDPTSTTRGRFHTLYFPETPGSPYFFTYRFSVDPLTLPSIAHRFSLAQLLEQMSRSALPVTEICIGIKTKFPFYHFFVGFIQWILESEMVARMHICDKIDGFLDNPKNVTPDVAVWPDQHRTRFLNDLIAFAAIPPPDPEIEVVLDSPPCRVFKWTRPRVDKNYFPLAAQLLVDVVRTTSQRTFIQLFSALLLEKTIVVFHTDETIVNNVILALHFMLRPLRWVSGSISILPDCLEDLLNAPNPLLVGMTKTLVELGTGFVYFNLVTREVRASDGDFPLLPKRAEMEKKLKHIWAQPSKTTDLIEILRQTGSAVTGFIDAIAPSIMADFSQSEVHSKFFLELFLKRFAREDRTFVQALAVTQMFQAEIEQACRRRSDAFSIQADNQT
jgi:hypothetical protein